MRKLIALATILFGIQIYAGATSQMVPLVHEAVPNALVCSSVTIGTTATEISGNTSVSSTTAGIYAIDIFQLTSTTTYCGDSINISTFSPNIGVPIPGLTANGNYTAPYQRFPFLINPSQKFYCIGQVSSASVMACKRH